MKKIFVVFMSLVFVLGAFSFISAADSGMDDREKAIGTEETKSSHKMIGSKVENMKREYLGKISDVKTDNEGRITFAILSHGGYFGKEKLIPIPAKAILSGEKNLVVVDISKERLESAPGYSKDDMPDMTNRAWVEETSRFYGVSPYWDESGMEHEMKKTMEKGEGSMEEMEHMEEIKDKPDKEYKY